MTDATVATGVAPWLERARGYIGKFHDGADVPALAGNIAAAFPDLAPYCGLAGPATSWCGIFVAKVLAEFGIRPPHADNDTGGFMYVDAWLHWGTEISPDQAQPGDVALFLGSPHHVTFVDRDGYCIGGNQSDSVTRSHYRQPDAVRRPPAPGAIPFVAAPAEPPAGADSGGAWSSGKGSWYSQFVGRFTWEDDGDKPNSAALGVPDQAQGISFYSRTALGQWFEVRAPNGETSIEQQTDIGPSPRTGRLIDISAAAAERFGYSPKNFPTDAVFSWRSVAAPAAVAGLSPQQQANAFYLQRGNNMATQNPIATVPAPAAGASIDLAAVLAAIVTLRNARIALGGQLGLDLDPLHMIAQLAGGAGATKSPAGVDVAAPAAQAPAAAPGGLAGVLASLGGGSNVTFYTGLLTAVAQIALNAFGVVGAPGGAGATVIGQLMTALAGSGVLAGLFQRLKPPATPAA